MERRSVSPPSGGRVMKRLRQGRDPAQGSASAEEAGEGETEVDLGVLLGTSQIPSLMYQFLTITTA
jgi:hypothetical protein